MVPLQNRVDVQDNVLTYCQVLGLSEEAVCVPPPGALRICRMK